MAQDNEQVCLLAFNIFSFVCILYSCQGIYLIYESYMKIVDPLEREKCGPYVTWKTTFLLHIIFFFVCIAFSVGTA
jgi:hypothetical protein